MVTAKTKYNPESAQSRAAQFISDREGNLPVWVRAPETLRMGGKRFHPFRVHP